MEYQREKFTDIIIAELVPLLESHYKEIEFHQDIKLNLDIKAYLELEDLGVLRVFTARDEGRLAGYCACIVRPSPHSMDSIQAFEDALYLAPEHRSRGIGYAFLAWCDENLRAEGVQVVNRNVKVAHNHGPLLAKLGYVPVETVHCRRLD